MKLLMFYRENLCYNTINFFSDRLADELKIIGYEIDFFDISPYLRTQPDADTLRGMILKGYNVALAVNAVGQQDWNIDGENIYDIMDIPFIDYIVDHPLGHHVALRNGPQKYYVICMDRDHLCFISKYFPLVKKAYFLPLGGLEQPTYNDDINFSDRRYDVVFTGTHESLVEIEDIIRGYTPGIRNLVISHIEYLLDHRDMSVEEGLDAVLKDMGIGPIPPAEYVNYAIATAVTNKYLKAYYREEVIRYLIETNIGLHIFGTGWEELKDEANGTVTLHEPVPYEKTSEIYNDSKIVLNIMPLFKNGSHDRIPSAMLSGSVVLTDHSKYIDEVFSDLVLTFDISKPWDLEGIIRNALAEEEKLEKMAERGRSFAKSRLTWKNVACEVSRIIETV